MECSGFFTKDVQMTSKGIVTVMEGSKNAATISGTNLFVK